MVSVLLFTSVPRNSPFAHSPPTRRPCACGIERATANVIATVCSAAARTFPSGAFATMTPWSVAASMSMLSTPMPARPTMTSSLAASKTASFTSVPDRTISALASATASSSASPSAS